MEANGGEKGSDFYAVLGLEKECTATELRNAYKKLALRWHPDRCCASGNSKFVEQAKKKFQSIQEAYSVLSDENKRFLYDVGVYDNDDDDENVNGMGDFLDEMVTMMSKTKPSENGKESFEELQKLFEDMFQGEINSFGCGSQDLNETTYMSCCESSDAKNKRNLTELNYGKTKVEDSAGFGAHFPSFCLGTGGTAASHSQGRERSKTRHSRRSRR